MGSRARARKELICLPKSNPRIYVLSNPAVAIAASKVAAQKGGEGATRGGRLTSWRLPGAMQRARADFPTGFGNSSKDLSTWVVGRTPSSSYHRARRGRAHQMGGCVRHGVGGTGAGPSCRACGFGCARLHASRRCVANTEDGSVALPVRIQERRNTMIRNQTRSAFRWIGAVSTLVLALVAAPQLSGPAGEARAATYAECEDAFLDSSASDTCKVSSISPSGESECSIAAECTKPGNPGGVVTSITVDLDDVDDLVNCQGTLDTSCPDQ